MTALTWRVCLALTLATSAVLAFAWWTASCHEREPIIVRDR